MRISHDIWTDLAYRESTGIEVTLLSSRASGRVKVAVADTKLAQGFEHDVAGTDALAAFYHPYAYAASGATRAGPASRMPTDLQPQS